MISERTNDGIERSPEQWFARANPTDPSKGGAEKTRAIHGHAWIEHARRQWADLTNKMLERLEREERVDHRSYARQGVEDEAGRHFGPAAAWITALAFALLSAVAVGTGYAWIAKPYASELETLRPHAELGALVEHRMSTMTSAERRQLDTLMKWKRGAR
jgi:hypothetical protein